MNHLKKTMLATATLILGLIGVASAQVTIQGEFSTDITFGEDNVMLSTPYTGLEFAGDQWTLSTMLSEDDNGNLNIGLDEAKYSWSVTDMFAVTFGRQAEPYGLAWGLHRPSTNWFVSVPREHVTQDGIGLAVTTDFGFGVQALYGNAIEDGGDNYWGLRASYSLSLETLKVAIGLSTNNNDAMLVDVTNSGDMIGVSYEVVLEYDMSDSDTEDYWLRSMIMPDFAKGTYFIIGMDSDEDDLVYGIGYQCSDKARISTELSGDGDTMIRVSYSF